ncbi:MAG: hypothetical protein IPF62_11840 [Bacteroidetes bacterium]|nr:hypothetical protein [Bacteroidota bacterium]
MYKITFFITIACLFTVIACKHAPIADPTKIILPTPDTLVQNSTNCDPDTVYFVNEILPILSSNCAMSGCHDATTHAEGIILNSYANIMQTGSVEAGKSNKSDLYESITETDLDKRMPRPPAAALLIDQIEKIKKWIDQGARNNYCDACDTTSPITYSTHIAALMQSNCVGCHSANNPGGGYDLSNYNNVYTIAMNAKLEGVINHTNGYIAMPKNMPQLSICDRTKIKKWILAGALNN